MQKSKLRLFRSGHGQRKYDTCSISWDLPVTILSKLYNKLIGKCCSAIKRHQRENRAGGLRKTSRIGML
jgi:hypothetical protein